MLRYILINVPTSTLASLGLVCLYQHRSAMITKNEQDGGRSSVVRASEFYSEDPGFDPLAVQGQGKRQFVVPLSQLLCRPFCVFSFLFLNFFNVSSDLCFRFLIMKKSTCFLHISFLWPAVQYSFLKTPKRGGVLPPIQVKTARNKSSLCPVRTLSTVDLVRVIFVIDRHGGLVVKASAS